jgi:hypothetical protein
MGDSIQAKLLFSSRDTFNFQLDKPRKRPFMGFIFDLKWGKLFLFSRPSGLILNDALSLTAK